MLTPFVQSRFLHFQIMVIAEVPSTCRAWDLWSNQRASAKYKQKNRAGNSQHWAFPSISPSIDDNNNCRYHNLCHRVYIHLTNYVQILIEEHCREDLHNPMQLILEINGVKLVPNNTTNHADIHCSKHSAQPFTATFLGNVSFQITSFIETRPFYSY